MRRLYYILFYCLVFALAWALDPPLIVRADYLRAHGPAPLRFQAAPAERVVVKAMPKEALEGSTLPTPETTNLPGVFPAGWPSEPEVITAKSPASSKGPAEQPFQFTPLPLPLPAETLTPQMLVPFFEVKGEKRGTNSLTSVTFDPPKPESRPASKAVLKTP